MLKIFGTDGIRCRVNQEPMTTDTCLKIAKAAGYLLSNKTKKKKFSENFYWDKIIKNYLIGVLKI